MQQSSRRSVATVRAAQASASQAVSTSALPRTPSAMVDQAAAAVQAALDAGRPLQTVFLLLPVNEKEVGRMLCWRSTRVPAHRNWPLSRPAVRSHGPPTQHSTAQLSTAAPCRRSYAQVDFNNTEPLDYPCSLQKVCPRPAGAACSVRRPPPAAARDRAGMHKNENKSCLVFYLFRAEADCILACRPLP